MNFFNKEKFIYSIIIFVLIISLFSLFERYQVEEKNKKVELIFDMKQLNKLNKEVGISFSDLKKDNVTGIAIYEDSLRSLNDEDEMKIIKGNELIRRNLFSENKSIFEDFSYDEDSAFLIFTNNELSNRAEEAVNYWKEISGIKIKSRYLSESKENFIIFFPDWEEDYLSISLGFDQNLITEIESNDLKVVPRIVNNENEISWDDNYDQLLLEELSPEYIIFAGDIISGYKENISKTAEIMNKNNIKLGMIESFIAKQKGVNSLAHLSEYNLMRVHSIQAEEMEKYSIQKVVDRYLRAVRERNVRILYLKPFLNSKDGLNITETNKKFLNDLTKGLQNDGFVLGSAETFDFFSNSKLSIYLISLGITGAGIILLEKLLGFNFKYIHYFIFLLAILFVTGFIYLNKIMFLRKLLALGSSIIFPSLAIITQFIDKKSNYIMSFFKAIAISFSGVIFMTASLSHLSFLVNIDQFRGVKFSFLLPIIFVLWYYLKKEYIEKKSLKEYLATMNEFLNLEIKVKHLLMSGFLGIVAVVYIARSGNYSFLSVMNIEIWFREFLEDILYVRPRFKAFLIGHPILVVALYYKEEIKSNLLMTILLVLASIGQITILNTFAHIHIPLKISFIRSFHGIWLGLLLGIIIIYILKPLKKSKERWLLDA